MSRQTPCFHCEGEQLDGHECEHCGRIHQWPKPEKPARMRVAQALGIKAPHEEGRCDVCGWPLVPSTENGCWATNCSMRPVPKRRSDEVPPYGEDSPEGWACTGPLVSRFKLYLYWDTELGCWVAQPKEGDTPPYHRSGSTAPEAIANLIIALAEAGKLEP